MPVFSILLDFVKKLYRRGTTLESFYLLIEKDEKMWRKIMIVMILEFALSQV